MKTNREVENNIKSYLQEGLFKRGEYNYLTDFYLDNARRSLSTAEALFRLSENNKLKKLFKLLDDFETHL